MTYEIFEGNMEKLDKKLNRIFNKCKAYGCDFHYEQTGEVFKTLKDDKGREYIARFIQIEVGGTAVINDWEFAAAVEHTENGNILTGVAGIEIPGRYYNSRPVCEHCRVNRYRKNTYIVRNIKSGEFKQVGRTCLKDFTHGMSAEAVASYTSLFDTLIEEQSREPGYHVEHYLPKEEYLLYAAETIRHFGYVRSNDEERQSTAIRALDYYEAERGRAVTKDYLKYLKDEMNAVGFNIECTETVRLVKSALGWIKDQDGYDNYMHNLKTVCGLEYVKYKNAGLLASLFPTYKRHTGNKKPFDPEKRSVYVGAVNGRVSIKIKSVKCMSTYETEYGTLHIYKFIGEDDNVYIWKTTCSVPDKSEGMLLTGVVKKHDEYRGVRQNVLSYCKIIPEDKADNLT